MIAPSFDRMASFGALRAAALRAARGHGASREVAAFLADLESEVLIMERELLAGTWMPRAHTTFRIREPKPRTISAAAFRDRVVHHAVCAELNPLFEARADHDSYACRPGKGSHAAVLRAQRHTRLHPWFVKLDIRHFFETVPHDRLLARLAACLTDARLRTVVERILVVGAPGAATGIPIGNLTSQHFGNFYLSFFDQFARRTLRVPALVRYMDDVLWFGPDNASVRAWATRAETWVNAELGLALKTEATIVAPVCAGVPYLGFRIWPRLVRLDSVRVRRLRRRLRTLRLLSAAGLLSDEDAQRRAGSVLAWATHADTLRLRQKIVAGGGEG
ncbi:hypothetical protein LBMAG42_03400 [Deltaproteobacteria bacterium]|nr:hypothetical protein LBMAG42_03400 [Deltaproteobacteria bacterium]